MRDRSTLLQPVERWFARRRTAGGEAPQLARPDPDRPAGTDMIPEIRHIVVLMMENHSYDNYLGMLERGDALPKDGDGPISVTNPGPDGNAVAPYHLETTKQEVGVPCQSWAATHRQWHDGLNDGFVQSAAEQGRRADPRLAMGYWTATDLPFYYGLAQTFPLADRWFSSCLGPTFPNRRFLVAGTANGLTSDRLTETFDYPANGTIFDLLTRHDISWANYHPVPHRRPVMARACQRAGTPGRAKAEPRRSNRRSPSFAGPKARPSPSCSSAPTRSPSVCSATHAMCDRWSDSSRMPRPAPCPQ